MVEGKFFKLSSEGGCLRPQDLKLGLLHRVPKDLELLLYNNTVSGAGVLCTAGAADKVCTRKVPCRGQGRCPEAYVRS